MYFTEEVIRVCLRSSAVAVAALLAAGCAELRWSKPGADAARLEEDLGQCRMEARLQAGRESVPRIPDPMGRAVVPQPRTRGTDPLVLELDLTSSCMRGKGYELAPVGKPRTAQAEG